MKFSKSIFNKKEKIEVLIHSLLENRRQGIADLELGSTLYRRRKEVVQYLDQNFKAETYDLMQRCHIYAFLSGLFVEEMDIIKPFFLKLMAFENDIETKEGLSRILTHKPSHPSSDLA